MAFAEVGSGSQRASVASSGVSASGNIQLAFPANVLSESLIVVPGAVYANTTAPDADGIVITDSRSTPFSIVRYTSPDDAKLVGFIGYGIAPSGGANTVQVAFDGSGSGTHYCSFSVDEFSGADASPLDVDGGSSRGENTSPSDSITTGVDDALVVGVMAHLAGAVYSMTPTYGTQIGEAEDNAVTQCHNAQFKIEGAAGAKSVTWTLGTSSTWHALTVSFKPSVSGVIPMKRRGMFFGV